MGFILSRHVPALRAIAKLLGTVSEFSKKDLVSSYGLRASGVRVFPNASDEAFSPASDTTKCKVQAELADGHPYFIYVGSFHPRKNVEGVFKAFEHYVGQGGQWRLVMVGEAMWSEGVMSSRRI